jgi:hypothetical protein
LARWFEQHCAFQKQMRARFREIEVPAHLKMALKTGYVPLAPRPWWRNPVWLAAAGVAVVLLALAGFWLNPRTPARFANYQARMVSTALREYRMDLVTNDMRQLRQFLAAKGAPADYDVTQGLSRLPLTGGGVLHWRSHPVAMVCFNRGDDQMLFLFVLNRSAVSDPPPATPQVAKTNDLQTVSWTRGDKTYVLAGPEEPDFLQKYF